MDAGVLDAGPGAPTLGTGLLDGEKALLHAHLTQAIAGGASARLGAGLGPGAAAMMALHQGGDADLDLLAGHRVFQAEIEVVAQIRAAVDAPTPAPAAAEDVAKDIAEDVAKATRRALTEAPLGIDPGMTELIIGRAFAGIREDLVGLLGLLELLFPLRAGVTVRMVFHGQAPVGLLDIGLAGVAGDPKDFVVIAFGHGGRDFRFAGGG